MELKPWKWWVSARRFWELAGIAAARHDEIHDRDEVIAELKGEVRDKSVLYVVLKDIEGKLAARNQVLELTASNMRQWQKAIHMVRCSKCSMPATGFEIHHRKTFTSHTVFELTDIGLRAVCRCGHHWPVEVTRVARN